MTNMRIVFALALAMPVLAPAVSQATQPALLKGNAESLLKLSEEARQALTEFHLKDVHPVSSLVPEIVLDDGVLRIRAARAIIDARVINIFLIRKARYVPMPQAATTAQAIDAWTNTVILGTPSGYGTSVDQWVAMAYFLGPRR